jgi:predicted esterase
MYGYEERLRLRPLWSQELMLSEDGLATDLFTTAQIKLYYDLYVPPDVTARAPLLIAVHGYGAHKRYMMREARRVAGPGVVIASIQGPHPHYRRTDDGYRVGYSWLSDHRPEEHVQMHHRFVVDVVDSLVQQGTVDRSKIFMYGFSQACALNFRFGFTYPQMLSGIIGVCGGIPGDLDSNETYQSMTGNVFYLYGDDDEFYTQDQFKTFDARLSSYLSSYRSKHYTAKHEITGEMRTDISEWLADLI